MNPEIILSALFAAIVIGFLVVDLGWLSRRAHAVSTHEAILQSAFWISVSLGFAGCVYAVLGALPAAEFVSAYVTEKMLSVDNLFVMLLIFSYFKVEGRLQHKVLYWGIIGAVILRGLFIGAGSVIVSHFHWVLYLFGVVLIYSGGKLLFGGDEDDSVDVENNRVLKWGRKHLPMTTNDYADRFITKENGKTVFTMLFLVLMVIETTDIVFAFDSIPAVFSISQDPFIIFTSNIFAVMGLRALFFLVENIMKKFTRLQSGVSLVLVFIGIKMFLPLVGIHIDSLVSFGVIIGLLTFSAAWSVVLPKK